MSTSKNPPKKWKQRAAMENWSRKPQSGPRFHLSHEAVNPVNKKIHQATSFVLCAWHCHDSWPTSGPPATSWKAKRVWMHYKTRFMCKKEDRWRESSREALGAIRGRKVCPSETGEGASDVINDREGEGERLRERENSCEVMGRNYCLLAASSCSTKETERECGWNWLWGWKFHSNCYWNPTPFWLWLVSLSASLLGRRPSSVWRFLSMLKNQFERFKKTKLFKFQVNALRQDLPEA